MAKETQAENLQPPKPPPLLQTAHKAQWGQPDVPAPNLMG
jgi:hypothetical protein